MRILIIGALALASIVATPANADEVALTVPVRIENMRYLDTASVSCSIAGAGAATLGRANVAVPLSNRAFHGNVTLTVPLASGRTTADAASYVCDMTYTYRPVTNVDEFAPIDRNYESNTRQTVASSVERVSGPIPH